MRVRSGVFLSVWLLVTALSFSICCFAVVKGKAAKIPQTKGFASYAVPPESSEETLRILWRDEVEVLRRIDVMFIDGSKGFISFNGMGTIDAVQVRFKDGSFATAAVAADQQHLGVIRYCRPNGVLQMLVEGYATNNLKAVWYAEDGKTVVARFGRDATGKIEKWLYDPAGKLHAHVTYQKEQDIFDATIFDAGGLPVYREVREAKSPAYGMKETSQAWLYRTDGTVSVHQVYQGGMMFIISSNLVEIEIFAADGKTVLESRKLAANENFSGIEPQYLVRPEKMVWEAERLYGEVFDEVPFALNRLWQLLPRQAE